MKREIRIVGFDDAPFDKFKKGDVLVVGTIFRGGDWIDGVLSTTVAVDGNDSTSKLIKLINSCKFKPQLRAIMLNGIAFGGFNIVDIEELWKKTKIPVIVVVRRKPDFAGIKRTLKIIKMAGKYKLIEKAGNVHRVGRVYIQYKGISFEKAKEILKLSCTRSFVPEPLRVSHLIASGVTEGQSRGRA